MKQCECSVTGAFRERHVGKLMPWIFGNYELHIAETWSCHLILKQILNDSLTQVGKVDRQFALNRYVLIHAVCSSLFAA